MDTLASKLQTLVDAREELRQEFNARGANIDAYDALSDYAQEFDNLITEISPLQADLLAAHNAKIQPRDIVLYGYQGNAEYTGIQSVNHYLASEMPTIDDTTYRVDPSANNYGYAFGSNGRSVEFICVHDTEDTAGDAAATGAWCCSADNTDSSWHFSVDDHSIYQHLPLTINGWHGGDGTTAANLQDTGIKFTHARPRVTIKGGYYVIDGQSTTITAPTTGPICELGIVCVKLPNGNYGIPSTYYNSTYECIASRGGNYNSIGIETCVKSGQDLFLTWHNTAKLVAKLLVDFNLGLDRVTFHNQFSGKPCPKTMITADLVDEFLHMVEIEYNVLASGQTVAFTDEEGNSISGRLESATNTKYLINNKLKLTSEVK